MRLSKAEKRAMENTKKQLKKERELETKEIMAFVRKHGFNLAILDDMYTEVKERRNEKKTILDEAQAFVKGPRQKDYKHPAANHSNIAALWNTYLGMIGRSRVISVVDVSILNILQKIARLATNQTHKDSLTDIAGYALCADMVNAVTETKSLFSRDIEKAQ